MRLQKSFPYIYGSSNLQFLIFGSLDAGFDIAWLILETIEQYLFEYSKLIILKMKIIILQFRNRLIRTPPRKARTGAYPGVQKTIQYE